MCRFAREKMVISTSQETRQAEAAGLIYGANMDSRTLCIFLLVTSFLF